MDLNKIVNDTLAKIETEGFIEKTVEKQLKSTIEDIISDLFRSYSDFGKELKKEVSSQLNIDFKQLKLDGYNVMVLNAVKEKLDEAVTVQGIEKIKESLDELLSDTKREYKLSELIEEMKRDAQEDGEFHEGDEISFYINPDRTCLTHIYFDKDSDVRNYSCQYRMRMDKDNKVCGVEIRDTKFDNKTIMGGLYGFEATLFKLYSSGCTLIIDEDNVNTQYNEKCED